MKTYWYLATPYTKFPGGLDAAHLMACQQAAVFVAARIPVFSPIAHFHPIAIGGCLDPKDHTIWLPADEPLMRAAHGLVVVKAESWDSSYGIAEEIKAFNAADKPVFYMDPGVIPAAILSARG